MRVVSLCGSLRPSSSTRLALNIALKAAHAAGADVSELSLAGLPWCDGRTGSYGPEVDNFRQTLRSADAILIGSPEYHGSFTGILKNALDLLEENELRGKLVGLVAVARGEAGAVNTLNHLRHVARWVDAWVLPAQVSIPNAGSAFSEDGSVSRPGLAEELERLGTELVRYGKLLGGS
jgi:FMN reductase